jgi:hypothetical protein
MLRIQLEQAEKVDLDEVMVEKPERTDFDELHEKLNISKLTIYELKHQ